MTTSNQDSAFIAEVIPSILLENALLWIRDNLPPEEVFRVHDLESWAEENGFKKAIS